MGAGAHLVARAFPLCTYRRAQLPGAPPPVLAWTPST